MLQKVFLQRCLVVAVMAETGVGGVKTSVVVVVEREKGRGGGWW